MPSYFYHLKIEVYPSPTAVPVEVKNATVGDSSSGPGNAIWLPPRQFEIFDELPAQYQSATHEPIRQQDQQSAAPVCSTHKPPQSSLIDCGTPRPPATEDERTVSILSERQRRQLHQRTLSFPPPPSSAGINPKTAARDWRFDKITIQSLDVVAAPRETMAGDAGSANAAAAVAAMGPSMSSAGKATKARFTPLRTSQTTIGWGVVHLYREGEESPGLGNPGAVLDDSEEAGLQAAVDCTTLCIPAVPSYLSPSDFLGFIGEMWRDRISHYRMVMTGRLNRYLVLMKFRSSKWARLFKREFDGKVFNDIEPEACTVAMIRSVTFETPSRPNESFPDLSQDPFTPATSTATAGSLKPFPPPTPDLIELPTCPVCLERMDDTTGLLTIPCQHVFHCSCLQKWKGSGCPVCRHTNPSISASSADNQPSSSSASYPTQPYDPANPYTQPFGSHISNLCYICDSADDLWICLICGNVGCGRYKRGHAKEHWKDTAHTFALEMDTQHVWDYAGDMWVHRLIREKGDGKVVELPGHHDSRREEEDVVPRAKLDSIGMEYTHLLASQLESQRVYFEEMLSKAADRAAQALAAAESASAQATKAQKELESLREDHRVLSTETLPALEKDIARERSRATKSTDLARNLSKSLQEEKQVGEGLMKRIQHVSKEMESLKEQVQTLTLENSDLKDQNHDLTMFISGQEKLKEMEATGAVAQDELEEGTASVPEGRRRKGKGRAKG